MELDPNGTALTLNIARTLTATEVEDLIHQLADLRLQMTPEVPDTTAKAAAADVKVLELGEPAIHWSWDGDGIQMLVASKSTGWLAIRIPGRHVAGVRELIGTQPSQAFRHSGPAS